MKQGSTNRKVNQQAREVIASILLFEISDPRLSLVTITGCEVSYDRSVCNVFYTADRGEYEEVAEAFEKASGLRCASSWINPWMRPSASHRRLSVMPSVIASLLPSPPSARPSRQLKKSIRNSGGAPL